MRYFLTRETQVTKGEFVSAERAAGFHNTHGVDDQEPCTAGFSSTLTKTSGRIEEDLPRPNEKDLVNEKTEEHSDV